MPSRASEILILGNRTAVPDERPRRASDLAEARALLQAVTPTVVAVEEAWFRSSGVETCAHLHVAYPSVPQVLVGSGATPPETLEAAAQAGIADLLMAAPTVESLALRLAAVQVGRSGERSPVRHPRAPRVIALGGTDTERCRQLSDLLAHSGYHVASLGTHEALPPGQALSPLDLLVLIPRGTVATPTSDPLSLIRSARLAAGAARVQVVVVADDYAGTRDAAPTGGDFLALPASLTDPEIVARIDKLLQRHTAALRADGRVPFYCPVEFREAGGVVAGPWNSAFSTDVSSGAIFLRTIAPPRVGCALELRIHLSTMREVLPLTGVVAWANPYRPPSSFLQPTGMAVQFLGALTRQLADLIEVCRAAAESRSPTSKPTMPKGSS